MPRIPIVSAQQGPGVLNLPAIQRQQGWDQVSQFGQQLSEIDAKLRAQQDDLDLMAGVGALETGIDEVKQKNLENPNYQSHEMSSILQFQDLSKRVREQYGTNTHVNRALQIKEQRLFGKAMIDVRHKSRALQGSAQLAQMDLEGERLSTLAAESTDTQKVKDYISDFETSVDRMNQRGFFGANGPEEATKKKMLFGQKVLSKNMDYQGRTDPTLFWERYAKGDFSGVEAVTREKIAEGVGRRQNEAESRAKTSFNEAKQVYANDAYGLANFGKFPQSRLNDILAGKDPFMDAHAGKTLARVNENAPNAAGNQSVMALQQAYRSGERSDKRIDYYRKQYQALADNLGAPNKALSTAFDELNSDRNALRTVKAAEQAAAFRAAEDQHRLNSKPVMPGFVGSIQKNRAEKESSEIRDRIRQGEHGPDIVKDIDARNAKRRKQAPQHKQDIEGLLQ